MLQLVKFMLDARPAARIALGCVRGVGVGVEPQDFDAELGGGVRKVVLGQTMNEFGICIVIQAIRASRGFGTDVEIVIWKRHAACAKLGEEAAVTIQ